MSESVWKNEMMKLIDMRYQVAEALTFSQDFPSEGKNAIVNSIFKKTTAELESFLCYTTGSPGVRPLTIRLNAHIPRVLIHSCFATIEFNPLMSGDAMASALYENQ